MNKSVLVTGGACWCTIINVDKLPDSQTTHLWGNGVHSTVGQMGAGKSLNLRRLGFKTTLHAYIGNDENGEKLKSFFAGQNVNFVTDIDPAGTETHINLMDPHGGRLSIVASKLAFEPEINFPLYEDLIMQNDYIALNIYNFCRRLIPLIKKYNKVIWCDLGDYEPDNPYFNDFAEAADYITMSSVKLNDHKGVMRQLMQKGKKLVVCTHGSGGSTALTPDGEFIETPIVESYRLVDANGAGDTFFAGLMYGTACGYPIQKALRTATVCAGLTITSRELYHPDLTEEFLAAEYREHFGES